MAIGLFPVNLASMAALGHGVSVVVAPRTDEDVIGSDAQANVASVKSTLVRLKQYTSEF